MTRQSRVFNRVYAPKRVRAGANNRREGCSDGLSTQVFPFPRRNGRKKIRGTCGRKERHRGAARGVNRGLTAPDPYQHSAETRSPESEARVRRAQPYACPALRSFTAKRRTRGKPEGAGSRKARRGCVPGVARVSERERWIRGCPKSRAVALVHFEVRVDGAARGCRSSAIMPKGLLGASL